LQIQRVLKSPGKDVEFSSTGLIDKYAAWILPTPAVIILVLLCIFPVIYTLYMGFHVWSGSRLVGPQFVGLQNYVDIFTTDQRFWDSVWRTVLFTAGALILQLTLGLGLALLFNREFLGRGLVRTLYLLPFVATPAAIALIWMMAAGVLNYLLNQVGISGQEWVYGQGQAIPALLIVDTWEFVPLITLICAAGLASLPDDIYESAQIDGANTLQQFVYITLPLLRPTIAVAALFRAIDALKTFDIIYIMTGGGPGYASETLNIYSYFVAFQYLRFGYASSLLVIFFALILGVSLVIIKLRRAAETAYV
jgi:multiple sugar transport system permease protein